MKGMFAHHGIPERLIADNMPFNSLKLVTSSIHYPKFNGLVERNVQTIKQMLRTADESKQDPFFAILEFRNTPISGMEESPAELLMSRKMRTRLPTFKSLLGLHLRFVTNCCHANKVRKHFMIVGLNHFPHCMRANR